MSITKSNGDASTKCDICISIVAVNGCYTGKKSVINHTPLSTISVSPKVYIEVIPFQLLLTIP
jgi:hypothetical protein